jgi:cytosolic carboxypeptidase protein 2/3
MKDPLKNKYFY